MINISNNWKNIYSILFQLNFMHHPIKMFKSIKFTKFLSSKKSLVILENKKKHVKKNKVLKLFLIMD